MYVKHFYMQFFFFKFLSKIHISEYPLHHCKCFSYTTYFIVSEFSYSIVRIFCRPNKCEEGKKNNSEIVFHISALKPSSDPSSEPSCRDSSTERSYHVFVKKSEKLYRYYRKKPTLSSVLPTNEYFLYF